MLVWRKTTWGQGGYQISWWRYHFGHSGFPKSSYLGGDSMASEDMLRIGITPLDIGMERHNHDRSHSLLVYLRQHKKETHAHLGCHSDF